MPSNNDYIDLNYEEISPQRAINGDSFTQGLCDWRFSISPSSGGAWIPSMSYFLIEYTFSNNGGTDAPVSSSKMTLGCDWAANLFTASSFKVAQYEICNVNSFHAQAHCLKKRLGYVHEDFAGLAYDRDGYDADFARRLAKTSVDGMYHKDGLIDCSNNNVPDSTAAFVNNGVAYTYKIPAGTGQAEIKSYLIAPQAGKTIGQTITLTTADVANLDWTLTVAGWTAIVAGDIVVIGTAAGVYVATILMATAANGGGTTSVLTGTLIALATGQANANAGVRFLYAATLAPTRQADPRVGKYLNNVLYQPPLGVFDISDPTLLFGDFAIVLTPNQNYKTAVIESITDKKEGSTNDYRFSIRSMKFYIAKCKIPQMPTPDTAFSMMEFQMLTKQLLVQSGTQTSDFMLPPSTQKIVVFIQDAAAGTVSSVNATRFKVRQYTNVPAISQRYGNYANTWDEFLQAIQVTFSGITKPQSMFQPVEPVDLNTNYMLQRWIHTNQMNRNPSPEGFEDWLSMGPYYAWDFSRDALSNGTYANVRVSYTPPSTYNTTNAPNVNLFIVAIHGRDVAIQYEQGRVVSVRSQIE